jgi:hypothetical protein
MPDETSPQLHIDSDWKAQAQAEKEALKANEAETTQTPEGGPNALPEPSMKALVGMLASQAIMGLGVMQDPETKGVMIDLQSSRYAIDILAVLQEKTKGNLSDEEDTELEQILVELRSRYVQVGDIVRQQQEAQPAGIIDPGGQNAPGPSGIVTP